MTKQIQTFNYYTDDADQNGDVYYDDSWSANSRPGIVVIHGGSWANASKEASTKISEMFYAAGFVVFNINYRLVSDNGSNKGWRWPYQRIDAALATNWFKANASKFGLNPSRVALYGFSAGGHVAAVVSGYYNSVRAVVTCSGVLQPHRLADVSMNGGWGNDMCTPTVVKLFGYACAALGYSYEPTWGNAGAAWNSFKPETYFGAEKPPFYAVQGDSDEAVPPSTIDAIEYWLTKAGQEHVTVKVAGRGHDETMLTGTGQDDMVRWNNMITWLRSKTN
jgi:acetyl esterase/lipase